MAAETEDGDDRLIQCAEHGAANATYICKHLAAKPAQRWFADAPEADWPWPDAWCAKCQAVHDAQGGWTDEGKEPPIALVCQHCYEAGRTLSAESLAGKQLKSWKALVRDSMNEMEDKQSTLGDTFQISRHERFDWDQKTGELVFSNAGKPAVIASVEFIGSVSTVSGTWLWAWANFSFLESMRAAVLKVRDFGEEHDYRKLTTPKWDATEHDGWEMAAVAAKLLEAPGVYRSPGKNGPLFLLIKDIRHAPDSH